MSEPKVSIIVTSYCPESAKYLELCVRSIRNLSYKNLETIIVGRPDYKPVFNQCKTISPPEQDFWNGRGINYGVEHSSGDYLLIINDDVILTKDCIQPLIGHAEFCNVMPVSNDQQGRYYFPLFGPTSIEEALEKEREWMNSFSHYPPGIILADTLCLYAHMVSKKIWDKVGPMDDNSGLIDIDWCMRVKQSGHHNVIAIDSFVIHFGGSSVEHTLDTAKRVKQKEQFKLKWGWCP